MDEKELEGYVLVAEKLRNKMKYNEEPVWYCESCLSLAIVYSDDKEVPHYCKDCSSTKVNNCDIGKWRCLYSLKYNVDYLNK